MSHNLWQVNVTTKRQILAGEGVDSEEIDWENLPADPSSIKDVIIHEKYGEFICQAKSNLSDLISHGLTQNLQYGSLGTQRQTIHLDVFSEFAYRLFRIVNPWRKYSLFETHVVNGSRHGANFRWIYSEFKINWHWFSFWCFVQDYTGTG